MRDPSYSGSSGSEVDHEDRQLESVVLSFVLTAHPALLTEDELIAELTREPASFGERDALTRTIGSLTRAGLLHRLDNFLLPSWAALKAAEMELS